MKEYKYRIADYLFAVKGDELCGILHQLDAFVPFEDNSPQSSQFEFVYSQYHPDSFEIQYSFEYEDVTGIFGTFEDNFVLKLQPEKNFPLYLWSRIDDNQVFVYGNMELRLLRFALWIGFGLKTFNNGTVAIHSSCIVSDKRAVIFLGESGTGKSTHTRLWRENIPGATLLNDDSPIVRVIDGTVWVYGSPWSGKTPCYKQQRYPLAACVRLSQAPYNKIHQLHVLKGYAALHPSCPPEFAYDERIYSHISNTLSGILASVPCYHLECLPDAAAAELSFNTVYGVK